LYNEALKRRTKEKLPAGEAKEQASTAEQHAGQYLARHGGFLAASWRKLSKAWQAAISSAKRPAIGDLL